MFKKTLTKFNSFSKTIKSMVFLFWTYKFIQIITDIFISTFVLIQTQSFKALIIYQIVYLTGTFFGFSMWGYLLSVFKISMKWNYLKAFILYLISFLILLLFHDNFTSLLVFAAINGLGMGMFWISTHSYEMLYTNDNGRDFYSSMLSTGSQILSIISPIIATALFFIAKYIVHTETFTFLFLILPFICLFALFFVFKLPHFIPPKISINDIKQLFFSKKIKTERLYYITSIAHHITILTIIPFLALTAMKNVINIGILETIMGIFSIIIVIALSHIRHQENRIKILLYATYGLITGSIFLFFSDISHYYYIVFALIFVFFKPMYRISQHVIDLYSIESITSKKIHFYPALLYRDFVLWIGRIAILGTLLFISVIVSSDIITSKIGVIIYMLGLIVTYLISKKMINSKNNCNTKSI